MSLVTITNDSVLEYIFISFVIITCTKLISRREYIWQSIIGVFMKIEDISNNIQNYRYKYELIKNNVAHINITITTTKIIRQAFSDCSSLTSINIPNSVREIGFWAFKCCNSLTSIIIPNSVSKIDIATFYKCTKLKYVLIPNSVTKIGAHAFENCSSINSITLPNNINEIGAYSFKNCISLVTIIIPNSITVIRPHTFEGCSSINSILLPNNVNEIGAYSFKNCVSLASIIIPNKVTKIGPSAFDGCINISSIKLPNSIAEIGLNAFRRCIGLKSIIIPSTVIELSSFWGCNNLESIIIEDNIVNNDKIFWQQRGVNIKTTNIIAKKKLQDFRKHVIGNYNYAELASLYMLKKEDNFQPYWISLNYLTPISQTLIIDMLLITPAEKELCLAPIRRNNAIVQIDKKNLSLLLEPLGNWAICCANSLINFLTLQDLAKILLAKLLAKSTFSSIANSRETIDTQSYSTTSPSVRYRLQSSQQYLTNKKIVNIAVQPEITLQPRK